MIIISWDVGVIHLAYCVIKYELNMNTNQYTYEILDWDNINLLDDDRLELKCCGIQKAKHNICDKKATFHLNLNNKEFGFCKLHLNQSKKYWSLDKTMKLFSPIKTSDKCTYIGKNQVCDKNAKMQYQKETFCTSHYKLKLNSKIKELSPKPINNIIVKKYPTSQLQMNLINKLDELLEHFKLLEIEEIIIENQPSYKNPKMKSIACTLFDYFLIKGFADKLINIKLVRYMCPSNKLMVDKHNTLGVFKKNKDFTKKYKLTKELGIKYTKQLLINHPNQLEFLELFKKKDDLCDSFLQGLYYLTYIKKF
uniref:Mitochondrial resolvase Ydc2 catalytic domain-containing protein n=1 Tax=viral metagenome TaxID=1070528 RepID=A0A6C0LQL0_9ZZZZ